MVTGILGAASSTAGPLAFLLAGPPALAAMVMGILVLVRSRSTPVTGRGMAVAGVVCGGAALVVVTLWILLIAALLVFASMRPPTPGGPSA